MFVVNHVGYCGMAQPRETFDDRQDARRRIAGKLRYYRKRDFPVSVIEKGREWEIEEPEDCLLIPDTCGVVTLTEVVEDEPDELTDL